MGKSHLIIRYPIRKALHPKPPRPGRLRPGLTPSAWGCTALVGPLITRHDKLSRQTVPSTFGRNSSLRLQYNSCSGLHALCWPSIDPIATETMSTYTECVTNNGEPHVPQKARWITDPESVWASSNNRRRFWPWVTLSWSLAYLLPAAKGEPQALRQLSQWHRMLAKGAPRSSY
jgi:hypothetical protein